MTITLKKKKKFVKNILAAALLASSAVSLAALTGRQAFAAPDAKINNRNASLLKDVSPLEADKKDDKKQETAELKLGLAGHLVTSFSLGYFDKIGGNTVNNTRVSIPELTIQAIGETTVKGNESALKDAAVGAILRARLFKGDPGSSHVILDRAYIYMHNKLGMVQLGSVDNPSHFMHYTAPWYMVDNGVDEPNAYNSGSDDPTFVTAVRQSTYAGMTYRSNKIAYYTPRVSGIQFGIAYTPDLATPFASTMRSFYTESAESMNMSDVVDAAVNYAFDLNKKWSVGVDGFYSIALHKNKKFNGEPGDPMELGGGAQFAYCMAGDCASDDGKKAIIIGGGIYFGKDITFGAVTRAPSPYAEKGSDVLSYSVGLEYDHDRWKFGVTYLGAHGSSKNKAIDKSTDMVGQLGGSYKVEEGVRLGLDVDYTRNKVGSSSGRNGYSANVLLGVDF